MEETRLLEIHLVAAQNLIPPSVNLRRGTFETYATAHVDPAWTVRTQSRPGPNPTWNDRFLFRVTPAMSSSVFVSIYAVGIFSDHLIGTVRFVLPASLPLSSSTPYFRTVGIRRPSGRVHGMLNIAAAIADGGSVVMASPAIGLRDLHAQNVLRRRQENGGRGRGGFLCCFGGAD